MCYVLLLTYLLTYLLIYLVIMHHHRVTCLKMKLDETTMLLLLTCRHVSDFSWPY